ncbi:MAG: radical SAM family heme chaperone HemW [Deltaproteobacteria bacterium]|nr:radical SAM family heme chaperone HemW [Deltaproteobacteria bacterium]
MSSSSSHAPSLASHSCKASALPPWGVYVHVPWCRRRCVYCDFVLSVGKADERFVPTVLREADARAEQCPKTAAQSLYFGGGTPTHVGASGLEELIGGLRERLPFVDDFECTVEANPEDLTQEMCDALARAGVTRLSIGMQSFDDDVLRSLGRKHRGKDARVALERALAFANVSCDLIIGVPSAGKERLSRDLKQLIESNVGHISTYMLTVEVDTTLHKLVQLKRRDDVDEDHQADEYEQVQRTLSEAGLRQYEISSFAKPGQESRHNRLYWGKGTWLGFGPGAHSLQMLDGGGHLRTHHDDDVDAWVAKLQPEYEEQLSAEQALVESLAFGLRDLLAGVSVTGLETRCGTSLPQKAKVQLAQEVAVGNVRADDDVYFLTSQGVLFADAIARRLL